MNREIAGMNRQGPVATSACRALINALRRVSKPVELLYERGVVEVEELGRRPAGPRSVATGLSGAAAELASESACTPQEFRAAVENKDYALLAGLADRLLVWRTMLMEPMKVEETRVTARVMAGGGTFAVEFPPGCGAAVLSPGASLVIAGHARQLDGAWVIGVSSWGLRAELDRGEPMKTCEWPEDEESPGEAALDW